MWAKDVKTYVVTLLFELRYYSQPVICDDCHYVIYMCAKVLGECYYFVSGPNIITFILMSWSDIGTSVLTCFYQCTREISHGKVLKIQHTNMYFTES